MPTRKSGVSLRPGPRHFRFFVVFLPPLLFVFALVGCASPGEPTARRPPIPRAVTDLAASQSGNNVVLTFALPQETVDRRPLEQPPTVEVYRELQPLPLSAAHTSTANFKLLVTVPSEMIGHYAANGRVRYVDPIPPDIYAASSAGLVPIYMVRTRASAKKSSADSNAVSLRVFPVPEPVIDLKGEVTPSAVELTWTPPKKDPTGAVPAIAGYRIYRAEARVNAASSSSGETAPPGSGPSGAAPPAGQTRPLPGIASSPPPLQTSLIVIGETDSPIYRDERIEFGKTYVYSVRSVVDHAGGAIESSDSNFLVITPRDIFPPAAPQGLVAAFVPAQAGISAHFDLSWAVSPENDAAGYHIYRSEEAGVLGTRLNNELLLTPAFRDMNVVSGRRYYYAVTAVDRSGNESAPSAAVSVVVPAVTQPNP